MFVYRHVDPTPAIEGSNGELESGGRRSKSTSNTETIANGISGHECNQIVAPHSLFCKIILPFPMEAEA